MKFLVLALFVLIVFNPEALKSQVSADVIQVQATGIKMNYTFQVTIKSPDKGCDQYADWWEVVSTDGVLIYRRILAHSHVKEQPFTRPGGNVQILADQDVIVRAHMNNTGYGGQVMIGSVKYGFQASNSKPGFAKDLEEKEPLPDDCDF